MLRAALRPFLVKTPLLILSTCLSLLGLELVLRAWPTLLGDVFANGVLSKYHTRPGGIYYRDRSLRMHFMIPNLKTRRYYNGYVWTHESDAYGFRNRGTSIPADIVLLGDSYIYGHGVDFESTAGYFLEQLTRLSVANLAQQGDLCVVSACETGSDPCPRYVWPPGRPYGLRFRDVPRTLTTHSQLRESDCRTRERVVFRVELEDPKRTLVLYRADALAYSTGRVLPKESLTAPREAHGYPPRRAPPWSSRRPSPLRSRRSYTQSL